MELGPVIAPHWCFLQQPVLGNCGLLSQGCVVEEVPPCFAGEAFAEWSWIGFRVLMWMTTCTHLAIQRWHKYDSRNEADSDRHGGGLWLKRLKLGAAWTPTIIAVVCGTSGWAWARPVQYIPLQLVGAVGSGFCVGLFVWVHYSLGRNWSPIPEAKQEHQLVVSGPYRLARHPMYAVLALWLVPVTAVTTLNWVLTLATSAALLEFIPRIPQEEAILVEQFGQQYVDYQTQVGALGPHLHLLLPRLCRKLLPTVMRKQDYAHISTDVETALAPAQLLAA